MTSLEERVGRLEDIEAIRLLMVRYAAAMDNYFDADTIASLFTENATWSILPASDIAGTHVGREEIRRFFATLTNEYAWTMHNMGNELIRLADDRRSAQGTWYLVDPCTMLGSEAGRKDAVLITGRYDNTFVKVDGQWYCDKLRGTTHAVSTWAEGWVAEPWRAGISDE